jgi:protein-S-isoprenylcysteine O-methyltransferase Ste14
LAFTTAAAVFVTLMITASVAVSFMNADALRPVRTTGPTVKRWSGYVLIAVGLWFILLAAVPGPVLLS